MLDLQVNMADLHADIIFGFVHQSDGLLKALDSRVGTIRLSQVRVENYDPSSKKSEQIKLESC